MLNLEDLYIFDCEVYAFDNVWVFKNALTSEYTLIHNDNESVMAFIQNRPLLVGYNNKHYDRFILQACLMDMTPPEVKRISDMIIVDEIPGWNIPVLQTDGGFGFRVRQFDLMDDTQAGTSLKAIEGHLGMDIRETTVPFDIDRPLTKAELDEVFFYCKHDVDTTHILYQLREVYIANKLTLAKEKGIELDKALYMTNAKLTAAYLDATLKKHNDEREYVFPSNILWEYIPQEVRDFFDRIHDKSIPDNVLFNSKLDIMVGDCPTKLGFGGIHGAIPKYQEEGDL